MNANELIEKVREFEDTIAKLTEQVANFRKQFENIETDEDKKFKRAERGETYYYITYDFEIGKFRVYPSSDDYTSDDDNLLNGNNYFLSFNRAQEVADKLNYIMRLERLHDELCPDFKPSRNRGETKHYIAFNTDQHRYCIDSNMYYYLDTQTYLPDIKTAKEACDILNGELEQTEE